MCWGQQPWPLTRTPRCGGNELTTNALAVYSTIAALAALFAELAPAQHGGAEQGNGASGVGGQKRKSWSPRPLRLLRLLRLLLRQLLLRRAATSSTKHIPLK